MGLEHPTGHHSVRFLAPLPQDFKSALEELGLVKQGGVAEGVASVVRPEDLQAAVESAWERLEQRA